MAQEARKKGRAFCRGEAVRVALAVLDEGRFDEARELLLREVSYSRGDAQLEAACALAKVEQCADRPRESLHVLAEHAPLAGETRDDRLAAKFHQYRAIGCQMLHEREGREGWADRALIEYEASVVRLERAGGADDCAAAGGTYNNIALLNVRLGRLDDARRNLAQARRLLAGRVVNLAQADDTEAQILLAEEPPTAERALAAYGLMLRVQSTFFEHEEWRLLGSTHATLQKAWADYQCARGGAAAA